MNLTVIGLIFAGFAVGMMGVYGAVKYVYLLRERERKRLQSAFDRMEMRR